MLKQFWKPTYSSVSVKGEPLPVTSRGEMSTMEKRSEFLGSSQGTRWDERASWESGLLPPFSSSVPSVPSGHKITGYIGRDICIECSPVTWSPYNETKDYKTEMIWHGSYSCMTSQDQWVQHVWMSAIMQFKVRSQGSGRDLQRGTQKAQGPCNVPVPRSACSIRILWTSVNKMCLHHFNIMTRNLWRWGLESC